MSATTTTTVEMFACLDSAGDYAVGSTEESAKEKYEEDVQALSDADGFRLVKVTLVVPLPEVVTLTGTVPADGEATLAVA